MTTAPLLPGDELAFYAEHRTSVEINSIFQGSYSGQALAAYAARLLRWSRAGLAVYCYFVNDEAGYAIANARRLQDSLES